MPRSPHPVAALALVSGIVLAGPPTGARAQEPLPVVVTPRGEDPVEAKWPLERLRIDADFGSAEVVAAQLAQVRFGSPDVVTTRGGTELRGKVLLATVQLEIAGATKHFDTAGLASIAVLDAAGLPAFGGGWMTNLGPLRLDQRGLQVTGTFGFDDEGTIRGTIRGGELAFEFEDGNDRGNGAFALDDGGFLRGERRGPHGGFWGGYRKAPALAPIRPGEIAAGQTGVGMRYQVRLPRAHAEGATWPAICILHGSNMTSRAYVETIVARWPELAERFAIVGLDGERLSPASRPDRPAFNYTYVNFGGPEVGPAWAHRQSPALVAESLRQLREDLPIDRWYLGGHSQGGFLTYAVLMFFPDVLAGAFPMSCNLLVQCEPDRFDEDARGRQHRVPVAVIHGRADDVVEFSGGAYCHLRLLDGGFPFVRLFAPERVGHQFALLPVDDAVRWLEQASAADASELLAFAERRAGDGAWRDVGAALQRLAPASEAMRERAARLAEQLHAAATPQAESLTRAIENDEDGAWVGDFLAFRATFGTAPAAAPALAAYAILRERQRTRGDELFGRARNAKDQDARHAIYERILADCYATKWYAPVRLWLGR